MDRIIKPAFSVIGIEGSTADGPGFIAALWEKANRRFPEIAALAKRNADGSLCGIWGAMSDMSRAFRPWEADFTRGLYLAGAEVRDDAQPPEGWVRWDIPGFEYVRVLNDTPHTFRRTLAALAAEGLTLAGAVQDFTAPATGTGYMLFPIRKL